MNSFYDFKMSFFIGKCGNSTVVSSSSGSNFYNEFLINIADCNPFLKFLFKKKIQKNAEIYKSYAIANRPGGAFEWLEASHFHSSYFFVVVIDR